MLSEAEFHDAYSQSSVHLQSALFSPKEIGPLKDDLQHNIIYKPGLQTAWFCSEPATIKIGSFDDLNDRLSNRLSGSKDIPLRKAARTIKETILDALPARIRDEAARLEDQFGNEFFVTGRDSGSTAIELAVAQEGSRITLGVQLVIAQPRS